MNSDGSEVNDPSGYGTLKDAIAAGTAAASAGGFHVVDTSTLGQVVYNTNNFPKTINQNIVLVSSPTKTAASNQFKRK